MCFWRRTIIREVVKQRETPTYRCLVVIMRGESLTSKIIECNTKEELEIVVANIRSYHTRNPNTGAHAIPLDRLQEYYA